MMAMDIVSWIIFGSILGIVVNAFSESETENNSYSKAILFGILGAIVGGWVTRGIIHLQVGGLNVSAFFIAILSSLLLLLITKRQYNV